MSWEMKESQIESITLLELHGRLTREEGSQPLEDKLQSLIVASRPAVLLECSQVSFIDSGGIGALVRAMITAKKRKGDLKLLNLSPKMRAALDIVGLLKSIEAYDDQAKALASFR